MDQRKNDICWMYWRAGVAVGMGLTFAVIVLVRVITGQDIGL